MGLRVHLPRTKLRRLPSSLLEFLHGEVQATALDVEILTILLT
jgi:hypothetical protein